MADAVRVDTFLLFLFKHHDSLRVSGPSAVSRHCVQTSQAIPLILIGQYLNYMTYKLLGVKGVYYGSRYGQHIEWITDFPFSVISNPQYIGCCLTIVGMAWFIPTWIVMYWVGLYILQAIIEGLEPYSDYDLEEQLYNFAEPNKRAYPYRLRAEKERRGRLLCKRHIYLSHRSLSRSSESISESDER